jgi:hypothetical protein
MSPRSSAAPRDKGGSRDRLPSIIMKFNAPLMLSISQFPDEVSMSPCAFDYALLLPDPCQESRMADKYQQIDLRTVTFTVGIPTALSSINCGHFVG